MEALKLETNTGSCLEVALEENTENERSLEVNSLTDVKKLDIENSSDLGEEVTAMLAATLFIMIAACMISAIIMYIAISA